MTISNMPSRENRTKYLETINNTLILHHEQQSIDCNILCEDETSQGFSIPVCELLTFVYSQRHWFISFWNLLMSVFCTVDQSKYNIIQSTEQLTGISISPNKIQEDSSLFYNLDFCNISLHLVISDTELHLIYDVLFSLFFIIQCKCFLIFMKIFK